MSTIENFFQERRPTEFPPAPVVVKGTQAFVVDCPFCDDVHVHGWGEGDPTEPGASLGMRLSHCLVGDRDCYDLVISPAGTVIPKRLRVRHHRDGRMSLAPRKTQTREVA